MKIPKQACTIEFKKLAVKRIKDVQSVGRVCKELGLSDQTVRNWVKAAARRKAQRSRRQSRDGRGNGAFKAARRESSAQAGA